MSSLERELKSQSLLKIINDCKNYSSSARRFSPYKENKRIAERSESQAMMQRSALAKSAILASSLEKEQRNLRRDLQMFTQCSMQMKSENKREFLIKKNDHNPILKRVISKFRRNSSPKNASNNSRCQHSLYMSRQQQKIKLALLTQSPEQQLQQQKYHRMSLLSQIINEKTKRQEKLMRERSRSRISRLSWK